jgi:uncharacterized membrane protein YqjE
MADAYDPEFPAGTGAGRAREPIERSPVEIIKDIVGNVQEIIRSEIRLARSEMTDNAKNAGRAGILLAAGAVLGLYAFAFLLVSIYNLLSYAIWPWVSALIIAVVLGVIAGALAAAGRTRWKQVSPAPRQAIESVKEDVQWLKKQTR